MHSPAGGQVLNPINLGDFQLPQCASVSLFKSDPIHNFLFFPNDL